MPDDDEEEAEAAAGMGFPPRDTGTRMARMGVTEEGDVGVEGVSDGEDAGAMAGDDVGLLSTASWLTCPADLASPARPIAAESALPTFFCCLRMRDSTFLSASADARSTAVCTAARSGDRSGRGGRPGDWNGEEEDDDEAEAEGGCGGASATDEDDDGTAEAKVSCAGRRTGDPADPGSVSSATSLRARSPEAPGLAIPVTAAPPRPTEECPVLPPPLPARPPLDALPALPALAGARGSDAGVVALVKDAGESACDAPGVSARVA